MICFLTDKRMAQIFSYLEMYLLVTILGYLPIYPRILARLSKDTWSFILGYRVSAYSSCGPPTLR